MGKGGYIGGSTLIGSGGWSSFDPAEDKRSYAKTKKKTVLSQVSGNRKKPRTTFEYAKLNYLHGLVLAQLTGASLPKIPKGMETTIGKEVELANGPIHWAKNQPDFKKIFEKKSKKLGKTPSSQRSKTLADGLKIGSSKKESNLDKSRIELVEFTTRLSELEAFAKKLQNEIADIQQTLKSAN